MPTPGERPLTPGTRLGPYEIVAAVGTGGMGEVYRGRDVRLDRTVAIKVLPVAEDPVLRQRFEREGRAISKLAHPHICALYDVGSHDGIEYLVMEYLEGETLANRLRRGRIPLPQVLQIAREIVEALDAAHSCGITHRDLKPGNVMLTRTGTKLLDFGLAKLRDPGAEVTRLLDARLEREHHTVGTDSDALTHEQPLTGTRMLLGTLDYMAPEQLEGRDADARTDIFAFGLVLFEMTTGRRAFEAKSQSALIGAILMSEPPPIRTLNPAVPTGLDHLIKRCLAKDSADRWQSARDVRWQLDAINPFPESAAPRGRRAASVALAGAAVAAAAVGGFVVASRNREPARMAVRAHVDVPDGGALAPEYYPAVAVSPDGTRIVFRAVLKDVTMLMMRRVDGTVAHPIAGTENGHTPFFPPNGEWLGFIADKKIKKVNLAGGSPVVVCAAPSLSPGSPGAAWGPDDSIVFAAGVDGLMRVRATGGVAELLTRRDEARGEHAHHGPQFLPGGRDLLFSVKTVSGESHPAILSLATRKSAWIEAVDAMAGAAAYVPTGHLVYPELASVGQLRAVPFDLASRRVSGEAIPLADEVYTQTPADVLMAQFSVSNMGVLGYITGRPPASSLVRVAVNGAATPLVNELRTYRYPRVSPNGRQVVVTVAEERSDIYLANVDRRTLRRLTAEGGNTQPVWTSDSRQIVFTSTRRGSQASDLYSIPADVGGDVTPRVVLSRPGGQFPSSWSPVAPLLAFYEIGNDTARDVWVWSGGADQPVKVLGTAASERSAVFSPDGGWLAYVSDESGRDEVYFQRYPGPGGREQISVEGGTEPVWAPDGGELYYRRGRTLYAVSVDRARGVPHGAPRVMFEAPFELAPADTGRANYDVFPDGRSFVFVSRDARNLDWHVHVVLNWFDELKRLLDAHTR